MNQLKNSSIMQWLMSLSYKKKMPWTRNNNKEKQERKQTQKEQESENPTKNSSWRMHFWELGDHGGKWSWVEKINKMKCEKEVYINTNKATTSWERIEIVQRENFF